MFGRLVVEFEAARFHRSGGAAEWQPTAELVAADESHVRN